MSKCTVKCGGFDSVRSECARDPCLGTQMCSVLHPDVEDCANWCCQSRSWYVFFIVFFFCLGAFMLCAFYYVYRLHQMNVKAGAVTETGEAVVIVAGPSEEELAADHRRKRNVKADPELLKNLNNAAK